MYIYLKFLISYFKNGKMPIRRGRNAPVTLIVPYESTSKTNPQ